MLSEVIEIPHPATIYQFKSSLILGLNMRLLFSAIFCVDVTKTLLSKQKAN
jgi:hypothetical protein